MSIQTYPEMNEQIKKLLRLDPNNSVDLYAAARIEELEAEIARLRAEIDRLKRGGWISVRERLPKIGDNVLVFYRRANEYGVDIMRFVGRWVKVDPLIEVTHWQPLPEPPKEG